MKKLLTLLFTILLCGCKDPGAWLAISNGFQQGMSQQPQPTYNIYQPQPPAPILAPAAPVYTEKVIVTNISGDFTGWDGDTAWAMDNQQVWQQSQYAYHYAYHYHPKVMIFHTSSGWQMRVEGESADVRVVRLK